MHSSVQRLSSADSLPSRFTRLRMAEAVLLACVALPIFITPSVQAQTATSATVRGYAIPAGPLGGALSRFAAEAGVQLSVDAALTAGLSSPGLQGTHSVASGFTNLLKGTGLTVITRGENEYTLQKLPATSVSETTLPSVTVSASNAVTEGTGAYTSGSTNTALGLNLSSRETPQSVSVLTRQLLDDRAVQSLEEALRNAPGITVTQLDSERYNFVSRGFNIDRLQYDGVPTQYVTNYAAGESEIDSVIYDRVEIVRGATGLLTGSGDPSASINLVRKRADSRVFTGTLNASVGSWDNYRASADLSTPLSEDGRVRGRLVVAEENKKSFVDNYSRERRTFYGTIGADLTSSTTLNAGLSYQSGRAKGVTYGGFPLVYSDGSTIDWRSYGRSFSIWPRWGTEDTDSTNLFTELAHDWRNGWKTTVLAMYSKQEVENTRLYAWGYPDPVTGVMNSNPSRVQFPGERTQRSLDVRTTGTFDAFGRSHDAVFGVSYSKQKHDFDRIGAADAVPVVSLFDWANYPEPTAWGASVKSETYERIQTGVYGALSLSLADPLKLIVGGRFNQWDRSGAGYMGRNPYDFQQSKFTPYAGLVYDLGSGYSLYGSYTSIYNPQSTQDRNGRFLDPAEGASWETGIKGEFLDGRIQASAALFRIEQDNLGVADGSQVVPGTTTRAYIAMPGVVSKGIEFELSGEIQPNWNLMFSASHYKATNAAGEDVLTDSSRTIARVFTSYRLPDSWNQWTVGGGVNWQSKTSNLTGSYHGNNPNGRGQYGQGGYALTNLMARYQITPKTALQLNVNNLFDKWYYTSTSFFEQVMWGAPRNFRLTLTHKF